MFCTSLSAKAMVGLLALGFTACSLDRPGVPAIDGSVPEPQIDAPIEIDAMQCENGPNLDFVPSNINPCAILPPMGDLVIPDTVSGWQFDTEDGILDELLTKERIPLVATQLNQLSGGQNVFVVSVNSLTIDGQTHAQGRFPLVIAAFGDVTINARLHAGAISPTLGGAGAGTCSGSAGDTQQEGGIGSDEGGSGGGGGGFGANGGDGAPLADSSGAATSGGEEVGDDMLVPLRGGCRGGDGGNGGGAGGSAGGAIHIIAKGSITVNSGGIVAARGGGGAGAPENSIGGGGGGGGSGGGILLEARRSIVIDGAVAANGGAGGEGNENLAVGQVTPGNGNNGSDVLPNPAQSNSNGDGGDGGNGGSRNSPAGNGQVGTGVDFPLSSKGGGGGGGSVGRIRLRSGQLSINGTVSPGPLITPL